jgi:3-oxoacyl-[acyl-carrier-protein] synthase II
LEVVVTGIGLICALGNSCHQSWQRLLAGETGITQQQPFPKLPLQPLAVVLPQTTSPNALLDHALEMAIADAGWNLPLEECGVVIGSSRSYQKTWEKWAAGNFLEEAFPWLETLPHMLAVRVARHVKATGPVSSPTSACTTGLWAIAQGWEWLKTGQCKRVIVGALESCISPLNITGFSQMGALASTGAYPFDRQRQGMVLGEGAAVLLMEIQEEAPLNSRKSYGQVLGFAFGNDAYHVTAPDPDYQVAAATIQRCLQRSKLLPEEISYIHAHGTGTRLNDQREAHLVEALFPKGVPISSTKGATGHTLGASGIIGSAFCLLALQQQILPPCVGLKDPEFDLNFVLNAQISSLETALCLSFGFGGQNGVVAFAR